MSAPFQPGDAVECINADVIYRPLCMSMRFRKIDDEVTEDFRQQMRSLGKPKKIGEGVS